VLAGVAATKGDRLRAAALSGAADALHTAIQAPLSPAEDAISERFLRSVREVDEISFSTAWARGREMTLDDAVEYACRRVG
jgi:hypothetical protein